MQNLMFKTKRPKYPCKSRFRLASIASVPCQHLKPQITSCEIVDWNNLLLRGGRSLLAVSIDRACTVVELLCVAAKCGLRPCESNRVSIIKTPSIF